MELDWLYGLVMGDGWICPPRGKSGTSYLRISHSIKQLEYLQWKAEKLRQMGIKVHINPLHHAQDKRTNKTYPVCTLATNQSKMWAELRAKLYAFRNTEGKTRKRITPTILKDWSLNTLLLLYLDDGYNYTNSNSIHLYTMQHPLEEQELLRDWIYDVTGAKLSVRKKKQYLYLYTCKDGEVFRSSLRTIYPEGLECMKYKMFHFKSKELPILSGNREQTNAKHKL